MKKLFEHWMFPPHDVKQLFTVPIFAGAYIKFYIQITLMISCWYFYHKINHYYLKCLSTGVPSSRCETIIYCPSICYHHLREVWRVWIVYLCFRQMVFKSFQKAFRNILEMLYILEIFDFIRQSEIKILDHLLYHNIVCISYRPKISRSKNYNTKYSDKFPSTICTRWISLTQLKRHLKV